MICQATKKCRVCGHQKPIDQFYLTGNGKGWIGPSYRCKGCHRKSSRQIKRRKLGWDDEKVRSDELHPRVAKQMPCGKCKRLVLAKSIAFGWCYECRAPYPQPYPDWSMQEWVEAVDRYGIEWICTMYSIFRALRNRCRQRMMLKDPWNRKLNNIMASLRIRSRDQITGAPQQTARPRPASWDESLSKSVALYEARIYRRTRRHDAWWRKFDTTARNWRRKAFKDGKGYSQGSAVAASEAELSVCSERQEVDTGELLA